MDNDSSFSYIRSCYTKFDVSDLMGNGQKNETRKTAKLQI